MKKTFYFIPILLISNFVFGQVGIGKQSVNGNNTILDFEDSSSNTNGIILPSVNNTSNALASTPSNNNGTFLFDKSDSKVKFYENSIWKDLSNAGSSTQITANTSSESSNSQGVIIGNSTSNAKGTLVLESTNKAVILPKVSNPHANVKNPYPGMMCYDTNSKSLAVYDGSVWSYWK